MSVLVCPVCQGAMKEVSRNGVMIDTCTRCRGVWLDRGELEKLAHAVGNADERGFFNASAGYRMRRDDDDDDDRRDGYGKPAKRKKSFLDFFD